MIRAHAIRPAAGIRIRNEGARVSLSDQRQTVTDINSRRRVADGDEINQEAR